MSNSEIKSLRLSERKIKCIKSLAFEIFNGNIDFNSYLYKAYKKLKDEIYNNPEKKQKVEDFEKLRYEVQLMAYTGEAKDEEKNKKLEEMYMTLVENKDIKKQEIISKVEYIKVKDDTCEAKLEAIEKLQDIIYIK